MAELLTKENFDEFIKSNKIVLVDFFNDGCVPCKRISPIIDKLEPEFEGKVKFAKIKVAGSLNIAMKYAVESVPTLLLFTDGEASYRHMGMADENQIRELLAKAE